MRPMAFEKIVLIVCLFITPLCFTAPEYIPEFPEQKVLKFENNPTYPGGAGAGISPASTPFGNPGPYSPNFLLSTPVYDKGILDSDLKREFLSPHDFWTSSWFFYWYNVAIYNPYAENAVDGFSTATGGPEIPDKLWNNRNLGGLTTWSVLPDLSEIGGLPYQEHYYGNYNVELWDLQLTQLKQSGVDLAMIVYFGDATLFEDRLELFGDRYYPPSSEDEVDMRLDMEGLNYINEALNNFSGGVPPKISMYFGVDFIAETNEDNIFDLTTMRGKDQFYSCISDFYSRFNPDHWAMIRKESGSEIELSVICQLSAFRRWLPETGTGLKISFFNEADYIDISNRALVIADANLYLDEELLDLDGDGLELTELDVHPSGTPDGDYDIDDFNLLYENPLDYARRKFNEEFNETTDPNVSLSITFIGDNQDLIDVDTTPPSPSQEENEFNWEAGHDTGFPLHRNKVDIAYASNFNSPARSKKDRGNAINRTFLETELLATGVETGTPWRDSIENGPYLRNSFVEIMPGLDKMKFGVQFGNLWNGVKWVSNYIRLTDFIDISDFLDTMITDPGTATPSIMEDDNEFWLSALLPRFIEVTVESPTIVIEMYQELWEAILQHRWIDGTEEKPHRMVNVNSWNEFFESTTISPMKEYTPWRRTVTGSLVTDEDRVIFNPQALNQNGEYVYSNARYSFISGKFNADPNPIIRYYLADQAIEKTTNNNLIVISLEHDPDPAVNGFISNLSFDNGGNFQPFLDTNGVTIVIPYNEVNLYQPSGNDELKVQIFSGIENGPSITLDSVKIIDNGIIEVDEDFSDGIIDTGIWTQNGAGITESNNLLTLPADTSIETVPAKNIEGSNAWKVEVAIENLDRTGWTLGERIFEVRIQKADNAEDYISFFYQLTFVPGTYTSKDGSIAMQDEGHFNSPVGVGGERLAYWDEYTRESNIDYGPNQIDINGKYFSDRTFEYSNRFEFPGYFTRAAYRYYFGSYSGLGLFSEINSDFETLSDLITESNVSNGKLTSAMRDEDLLDLSLVDNALFIHYQYWIHRGQAPLESDVTYHLNNSTPYSALRDALLNEEPFDQTLIEQALEQILSITPDSGEVNALIGEGLQPSELRDRLINDQYTYNSVPYRFSTIEPFQNAANILDFRGDAHPTVVGGTYDGLDYHSMLYQASLDMLDNPIDLNHYYNLLVRLYANLIGTTTAEMMVGVENGNPQITVIAEDDSIVTAAFPMGYLAAYGDVLALGSYQPTDEDIVIYDDSATPAVIGVFECKCDGSEGNILIAGTINVQPDLSGLTDTAFELKNDIGDVILALNNSGDLYIQNDPLTSVTELDGFVQPLPITP